MLYLTMGTYTEISLSLINADTKKDITDLSSVTEIKFQFKELITDTTPIISKTFTDGDIVINSPYTGDITIKIYPDDFTDIDEGLKFVGCQIEYSDTNIIAVEITKNGKVIEQILFAENPVS